MQHRSHQPMPDARQADITSHTIKDRRGLTLVTLCLAVLIAQVDTSVVNLATHPIALFFNAGVSQIQWVLDAYNLTYAAFLLTGGLLADLYGRRRIFMTGVGIFAGASLLCALSPAMDLLITGRAIAGLGAALMIPASLAIVRVVWTDVGSRARVLGIWAACNGLALAMGPSIGGVLIDHYGWRSIFLLVVPLALAAVALSHLSIRESSNPEGRHPQFIAQGLGILVLGGLAVAAISAHGAPEHAMFALIVTVVALTLFVRAQHRAGSQAMVPLDLFRQGPFRGAMIATGGMTFGMYGALFLVPLVWEDTAVLGPTGAGLALMPMALAFVLVSPFSGFLAGWLGSRIMTTGGMIVISSGLISTGLGAGHGSLTVTELGLISTGLGMGLASGPLFGLAVGSVSASRAGSASALINVARMVGATLGVALLGTVFVIFRGGKMGLEAALLMGGGVQLGCTALMARPARLNKRES